MAETDISTDEQVRSLKRVVSYRPLFTGFIIGFSFFVTLLEGIGLSFLFPIIEVAQAGGQLGETADGIPGLFFSTYAMFGVPFTLESMIAGLALVMIVRYTSSFVASWLAVKLTKEYERDLKVRAYELAMGGSVSYYDEKGSDDILNAIITQTRYAGKVINRVIRFVQDIFLALMYAALAMFIAPVLTVLTAVFLGVVTYLVRYVVEPGYTVGETVAAANEQLQKNVQAGTQGIREVKLFGMTTDLLSEFRQIVGTYTDVSIRLQRNKAAISNFYQLTVALTLFGLIYAAISFSTLSVSALGVFLFAMFRLSSQVSRLNSRLYSIESGLPHLVRTHRFVDQLTENQEPSGGTEPVPDHLENVVFDAVSFSYEENEPVLRNISFEVERGEFVGIVGESGAGKSTVVSLLARTYEPDDGEIRANGAPIHEFGIREWRRNVALVRQDPHIFNDTLHYNITLGREVPDERLERVSEAAQLTEFLDELPRGYDTVLGDDGVKLSGGQRQRVALARALVTDAEVLLLDEATSDLDSNLERQIHRTIESIDGERTVITITHRLSTIANADRIYTVDDGRITERGSHGDLVENDGTYAQLYSIQTNSVG
jgi:subfamily B ATP-binding cassette protein MsbA